MRELLRRRPVSAPLDISIREAARIMSRHRVSSLVLTKPGGAPVAIVTDRDLRERVAAPGLDGAEPVAAVMNPLRLAVGPDDTGFDALLTMLRGGVHHLPVLEGGRLLGMITNHDLMLLQGTSPLSLVHDIINQTTVEALIPLSQKTNSIVGLLIKEEAKAGQITQIITEINDRLITRVLEIAEGRFGPPPLPYCWILFGSEGRKEQTFKTDQDNALIYSDPLTPVVAEEAQRYFSRFTAFVTDSLIKIGFPLCPAGYMASNPEWCRPLSAWKKYFSSWIDEPVPENLLKFLVFYDLRPIHGKIVLAQELRDFVVKSLEGRTLFLGYMANAVLQFTPPIGFFRNFVVEKSGEHKDKLDLKVKGITPLLNAVRLFAMERGVRETGTLERLITLQTRHSIVQEQFDELEHAFEFVMFLRIHHQFEQIQNGRTPDNFVNPNDLSNLEKKTLKESFNLMTKIQGLIVERYKVFIR